MIGLVEHAKGRVFSTVSTENDLLHSVDAGDDPSRNMVRQILGAVSEYERAVIRLRLRSGKLAKGGYIGGRVPMGFELAEDGDALVPSDRDRAAIARMVELRDTGATLRQVCDVLTSEGYETKHGGPWHPTVVMRVVGRARLSAAA